MQTTDIYIDQPFVEKLRPGDLLRATKDGLGGFLGLGYIYAPYIPLIQTPEGLTEEQKKAWSKVQAMANLKGQQIDAGYRLDNSLPCVFLGLEFEQINLSQVCASIKVLQGEQVCLLEFYCGTRDLCIRRIETRFRPWNENS